MSPNLVCVLECIVALMEMEKPGITLRIGGNNIVFFVLLTFPLLSALSRLFAHFLFLFIFFAIILLLFVSLVSLFLLFRRVFLG